MGESGEDIQLSPAARKLIPYAIECKNQEKINIWKSYFQAQENSNEHEHIVVIKRNNHKPLLLIDAEHFIDLHSKNERK